MSLRHKFDIGGHEGYIHVGLYETGAPGEIFIKMAKEGSTVSGLIDAWGIQTSMSLQYGVPVEQIVDKFSYTSFEPSGWTAEPGIGHARSILDYVARWLEKKFIHGAVELSTAAVPEAVAVEESTDSYDTGLACPSCGNTTQRAGACATCSVCGWNQGCG
jgi:ribonucleoside-diphosphate reductase alpha chain